MSGIITSKPSLSHKSVSTELLGGSPPSASVGDEHAISVKPFTVWSPSQFMGYKIPEGHDILGDGIIQMSEMTCLIGQGGSGKSRLSLWLALCQITGREWCDIPTHGPSRKWLFLGNENSIVRYQRDLMKMLKNFTKAEIELIEDNLRLPAVLSMDDALLSVENPETLAKLKVTIEQELPDVVVVDPFEAFMDGDINFMPAVRGTVTAINQAVRQFVPHAAILIIHHARTGAANQKQGIDIFNSGNFAKGAKSLYSMVRSQINLMPGDAEDENRLVLACGKSNNSTRFETRGLLMDSETFRYSIDPNFTLSAWLNDVDGKRGQKSAAIIDVLNAIKSGKSQREDICGAVMSETGCSKRTVNTRIADAVKNIYIRSVDGKRGAFELTPHGEKTLCKA